MDVPVTSIIQLLEKQASAHPSLPAISSMGRAGTETITWSEYHDLVQCAASGLVELGVAEGHTVAILAGNRPEHYVADLAAVLCAAATVSLYPTLSDHQLAHVLKDAAPSVVLVQGKANLVRVQVAFGAERLPWIVELDASAPDPAKPMAEATAQDQAADNTITWERLLDLGADKLEKNRSFTSGRDPAIGDRVATYVYTSGTTGAPKGVALTHRNVLWQLDAWERMGLFAPYYRVVSYLPLAHIAERLWSLYFPLKAGGHIFCCPESSRLVEFLRLHRPSFFMGVPRIWEKLRDAMQNILASSAFQARDVEIARDRALLVQIWPGRETDLPIAPAARMDAIHAREGPLHELRAALGMDSLIFATSGAAPLAEDIKVFFASIGIDITQAYGLTETTGIATWERRPGGGAGCVGLPLPGCEIKLAPDGEVLIKCPGNTAGYRHVSNTESALYRGDWLASGDIGSFDPAGRLLIVDRKKELIVNSAGKNISPTAIEFGLSGKGFIDRALAIGDQKPFIVSILTVRRNALIEFARRSGIEADITDLVRHPAVLDEVQRLVDQCNEGLSRPEQVKRFTLVADDWSVDTGELTPTMKLRRRPVEAKYASIIAEMYSTSSEKTGQALDGPSFNRTSRKDHRV